jgi:KDO2-lipid IV(A) lauroyltransferase
VLLTGHLGNWELGAVFVGKHNIKINVVTFRDGIETIDDIRERYRKQHNVHTVILGDSPFATLELANALQRNEVVAMLVDRSRIGPGNDTGNSIGVNFFGKTAHFPGGPFALARVTGASILPAFIVKDGNGYRVIVEKPVIIENGEENIEQYAKDIITLFENRIREYPDQWYNFVEI